MLKRDAKKIQNVIHSVALS